MYWKQAFDLEKNAAGTLEAYSHVSLGGLGVFDGWLFARAELISALDCAAVRDRVPRKSIFQESKR